MESLHFLAQMEFWLFPMLHKEDVVRVARMYVGMPFRAQGRGIPGNRYAAIDCGGLLVCVGEDLGLIDKNGVPFLRSDYSDCGPQPCLLYTSRCV